MVFSNYTVADVVGILIAVVVFFPLLFVPGYVIGWITNTLQFRDLTPRWRAVLSIPLSMAICPATIYCCASLTGWPGVSVVFVAFLAVWLWLFTGRMGHERFGTWFKDVSGIRAGIWLAALAWMFIAIASLADIQIHNKLYFSATAFDHSVRTAITDAIARVGAHPHNPFYYLTGPVPLRYHYFWLLPCGFLAHVMGGVISARVCMFASAVWCGWGFMALIPSAFRFLLGFEGAALRRRCYLGLAFTAVTGLDLIPTVYFFTQSVVYPDMEWWNNNQITSLWGSALWIPHHFAALVIGITGFLISWDAGTATERRRWISCSLLGGVAYGSLVGTSVYVAVVMAAFLALWTAIALAKRETNQWLSLGIAGCLAVAIAVPYLHSLAGPGEGGPFMRLSVRHFRPIDSFVSTHHVGELGSMLLRLIGIPVCYFVELGFFFAAGIVFLWNAKGTRDLSPALKATALLAGVSVFICSFFRSGVISTNDLGARGFLPAQFVLLLWAAHLFSHWDLRSAPQHTGIRRTRWKWGWALLLVLGVGGTFYQVSMLRVHGMLADRGLIWPWFAPDRQLGERTYALRKAYDAEKIRLGTDVVIQNNPKWIYDDLYFGLYSDQQTAAYDPLCGAQFGGDPHACARDLPALTSLFADGDAFDVNRVIELCRSLKVKALVVKDKDGIWDRPPAWLRTLPVIAENAHARIVEIPGDAPPLSSGHATANPVANTPLAETAQ